MDLASYIATHPWAMYVIALVLPFVQEDAAVIGAATASIAGHANPAALFAVTLVGLTLSDVWKYWAGRLAGAYPWAARLTKDPRVEAARDRVINRLGLTLLVARFVPGTRIPLYVACGLFRAPFWRFLCLIVLSATLYIGIAFTVLATLGAAVGEQVRGAIPIVVIAAIVLVLGIGWIRRTFGAKAV
jgi:membrane protein DedA with SNARE-associated domain